jgi:dihydropteroate synthase
MENRNWSLAHGRSIELGAQAIVMGILNVTPDSFSDGNSAMTVDAAIAQALAMAGEGASIIDIGGESTRPDAEPVSPLEEQRRIMPVIAELARNRDLLISVDTYREETARMAIEVGAHIVNDIWGLQREPAIARIAALTGCGLVLMHNGRDRYRLPDLIEDQTTFFGRSLSIARETDLGDDQIVLDPGFGFAKDPAENLELIARFVELQSMGFPLLVGTSRKRFLGNVTGRPIAERDTATAASSAILRLRGAAIFRVHNVSSTVDALKLADAVLEREELRKAP